MYQNPAHIRDNRLNVRINDFELERLERLAEIHGKQKTTIGYEALIVYLAHLEQLEKECSNESNLLTGAC